MGDGVGSVLGSIVGVCCGAGDGNGVGGGVGMFVGFGVGNFDGELVGPAKPFGIWDFLIRHSVFECHILLRCCSRNLHHCSHNRFHDNICCMWH